MLLLKSVENMLMKMCTILGMQCLVSVVVIPDPMENLRKLLSKDQCIFAEKIERCHRTVSNI